MITENQTIRVTTSHPYDVIICSNQLQYIGASIRQRLPLCRIAILSDDNVAPLYSDTVIRSLQEEGYECHLHSIPHGESNKNMETIMGFIAFMANRHITRTDAVLALGGGVVGDMAGFASAIYLRGIKYIQVPTTLLAAVDSSVGGKTAVDIAEGKNLIGAFHQPSVVYCDISTLHSLPSNILRDGYAEVIKYGMILDRKLFNLLSKRNDDNLQSIIARCVELKRDIVIEDEFDKCNRQLLNFGHTFGHSIELLSNFAITHGEAVAKGMVIAAKIGVEYGLSNHITTLSNILEEYGFNTTCPYSWDEIYNGLLTDKKRQQDSITIVLPEEIGHATLNTVSTEDLKNLLERIDI